MLLASLPLSAGKCIALRTESMILLDFAGIPRHSISTT
uniref:Uncharacterized protein n=1 Tax=Anopheles quadriannulatus TaxID=34691 RepID=A0A182XT11_ANOQN